MSFSFLCVFSFNNFVFHDDGTESVEVAIAKRVPIDVKSKLGLIRNA